MYSLAAIAALWQSTTSRVCLGPRAEVSSTSSLLSRLMAAPSGVMRPPPSHHRQLKDRSYEEEDEEQTRPASKRPFSGPDWPRGMCKELGTQPRRELERNAPHDISVRQLSLSCVWRFGSTWGHPPIPPGDQTTIYSLFVPN